MKINDTPFNTSEKSKSPEIEGIKDLEQGLQSAQTQHTQTQIKNLAQGLQNTQTQYGISYEKRPTCHCHDCTQARRHMPSHLFAGGFGAL
jgi:hypothetical protein